VLRNMQDLEEGLQRFSGGHRATVRIAGITSALRVLLLTASQSAVSSIAARRSGDRSAIFAGVWLHAHKTVANPMAASIRIMVISRRASTSTPVQTYRAAPTDAR